MNSRIVLAVILICLVSSLGGCASLPERVVLRGSLLRPPWNTVQPSREYELVTFRTREGTKIGAQFGAALDSEGKPLSASEHRPTVMFFYGNSWCVADSQPVFEWFRRMGVNVLIPDYTGYGMSEGARSEQGCYATADAAYNYLVHRDDIDPRQIVVAGFSIGCCPAVYLSSHERVAGLILICPPANVREIGRDFLPWYLRWAVPVLAPHPAFDNLARISQVSCPILFVQAKNDKFISARQSDRLAAAVTTKMVRVVLDTDHDGAWRVGQKEIRDWLRVTRILTEREAIEGSEPNQALEPTPTAVKSRADARLAPSAVVAHL